jgi:hypothetical protein
MLMHMTSRFKQLRRQMNGEAYRRSSSFYLSGESERD